MYIVPFKYQVFTILACVVYTCFEINLEDRYMYSNNSMFGNGINSFMGNTMPTGNQPYGVPITPYTGMSVNPYTQNQPNPQPQINTNKVYVSGMDDAKTRYLAPNSDYIFLDNDKPILYRKVVDGTGKMEIQAFEIVPYTEKTDTQNANIDYSKFVSAEEFNKFRQEFMDFKNQMNDLDKPLTDK